MQTASKGSDYCVKDKFLMLLINIAKLTPQKILILNNQQADRTLNVRYLKVFSNLISEHLYLIFFHIWLLLKWNTFLVVYWLFTILSLISCYSNCWQFPPCINWNVFCVSFGLAIALYTLSNFCTFPTLILIVMVP